MNKSKIDRLERQVTEVFKHKERPVFPIMGGFTAGEHIRQITPQEYEILRSKELPIPISISVNREHEFQEYLKS